MSGSIPIELGNLTQLTGLGLEFNQLTGGIPAELGDLAQLTWLNLAFNQLTGSLPTEIGGLTQLTGLYLVFNQLSGEFPSSITNLVNLTTLTFDCWLTSSDPVVIAFLNEKSAYQCAPNLQALPDQEQVSGENWTLGKTVTIEIDDPATQDVNPDHTGQAVVGIADWDPQKTWFGFNFIGEYDLKPGDLVTVFDDTTIKTHTVTNLAITNIYPDTNMVSGTTNTSGSVDIWICDENNCVVRKEPVDLNGNWSANFGEPGDEGGEEDTFDIQSYSRVDAAQYDQERDSTQVNWSVPIPTIEALGTNKLGGYGWPLGFEVTITIDDPSNGAGVDYEAVQMPFDDPQNPGITTLDVPIGGTFKLKPGYIIQATNGQTAKTLVYTYLEVTQVDIITETINGVSDPNVNLNVQSCGVSLDVTADSNGNWQADFQGIYNLTSSTRGQVRQTDADGDAIVQFWGGLPRMSIYLLDNSVQGLRWSVGYPVTLTIDDPDNGQGADYTDTKTVEIAWWNPDETNVEFYFEPFELQPGQLITMTDGEIIITHIVTNLAVIGVDTDADTVTGTANPGSLVEIGWLCDENGCAFRRTSADVNGDWLMDFSTPGEESDEQDLFDIRPGATIDVQHKDDFGNVESIYWNVPLNQSPTANAGEPYFSYWDSNIALDASASSDPDGDMLTYEWDLDNDGQYDDASGMTATTSFSQVGDHIIGLRVTDDDGLSDTDTAIVTVLPWTLTGFYQPVDMNGVYNTVKGGSTVPLKFEIFAGSTELTDVASVRSLTYAQTSCDTTAITDEIETTATGNTSLRYADGQFIYNWKTPKSPGKCYRVTMATMDGSSLMAYFKLK